MHARYKFWWNNFQKHDNHERGLNNKYHSGKSRASSFTGQIMVGHTHEDVNQMFPRVWLYIAKKSVPTISIYDLAIEADNPMPNVQHLENIWYYRKMGI